jgi:capsule biosynthesis phosphatase
MYSYITIDDISPDGESGNRLIMDVKEKVKISDYANSGCYCFEDGNTLAEYCIKIIDHALMQKSQDGVGEFYTSGVIKAMLEDKHPFEAILLQRSDMQVLGTPQQVIDFCKEWKEQPALRFVFDLDNTLGTAPHVKGDYTTCEPILHTIEYLRQVKAQGHTVVIATARRMRTHKHNVAAVVADIGKLTMDWLEKHDIPYDEIFFGKPWGHFYVDDLAICPFQGSTPLALAKQTGFYETTIKARKTAGGAGPGVVVSSSENAVVDDNPPTSKAAYGGAGGGQATRAPGLEKFAFGVGVGITAALLSQTAMKYWRKQ